MARSSSSSRRPRPGQFAGKGARLRAVPGIRDRSAETRERLNAARPQPFRPRDALRRAGFEARATASTGRRAAGRSARYLEREPGLRGFAPSSFSELALYAAASFLGLALLDAALRGRGPAGVERLLGIAGGGIRRLFDSSDPLLGATDAPPFRAGEGLGSSSSTSTRPASSGSAGVTAKGIYPLGRRGAIIGTPNAGTHTLGNWQSDNAVDIKVPVGTPVFAVTDGTIARAGSLGSSNPRFAGLRVELDGRANDFYYAHLSRLAPGITEGARVQAGDLLGWSGSANGVAHLHFGVHHGSPFSWVRARLQQLAEAIK